MAVDTFNMNVYKKQIANTAKTLLREASTLAQARGKKAYVHVVRLGLGVCWNFKEQDELFVEAWGDALRSIADLGHVTFVDFSYVNCNSVYGAKNNQKLPGTDVFIRFSKRNLHDKVPEDCICVCNYAWQGNSLPGSEFWVTKPRSSGDSAASCSSLVTEIQTHFINPVVCGAAVRIVAEEGQLLNVSDILEVMQGEEVNCHELKLPSSTRASRDHEQIENGINTSARQGTERYVVPAPEPDLNLVEKDWEETSETSIMVHGDAMNKTMGPADKVVATTSASPNSVWPAPAPHVPNLSENDSETHKFKDTVKLTDEVQETIQVLLSSKGRQENRSGDTLRSNGALDKPGRHGSVQGPMGIQPGPPQDKNNSPIRADVKNQRGYRSAGKPDYNTPRGTSNGNNEEVGENGCKNWNNRNSQNSGKSDLSTKANGYDSQSQSQFQAGEAGTRQRPRSSNPRTVYNYITEPPIEHQFINHARLILHKRVTPITPVSLDGVPSNEAIASLGKSDLTVSSTTLDDVIEKSIKFWDKFPSETARLHVLKESGVDGRKLEDFVHSVYPIVHHTSLQLLWDFLEHKKRHGTNKEKNVYRDMDIIGFIDRLMKKRPMSFLGADDRYYLPPPTFKQGFGGFEAIGSEGETYPLVLADFLSYDEMRLSALFSLSSWSWFVNDGRRMNFGEKDPDHKYQNEGVIVGQVGARLRKEGVMEYVDCVVTHRQNRPENGFGNKNHSHINAVWGKFWGGDLPTYQDANACLQAQRGGVQEPPFEYFAVGKDNIFNITVYKKRIAITAEILLCEANTRARACGKKAYVHVVGLGLGVWRAFEEQDELFVEAWGDALRNITDLRHVAFVDFSFINCFNVHGTKNNEKFPGTDVVIKFSKRNLHDKVPEDCVLVCNYAWDGNSLPGNEFWMGKLCSTGDSAAACSSCVAEIHTHYINPVVCGAAVRIATKDGQLLDVSDYVKKMQGNSPDFSVLNHYGVKHPCSSGGAVKRLKPTQQQNSGYPQVQTTRVAAAEQHATPALECAPHSSGAWGSSDNSWARDVDQTNALVEPSAQVGAAAPVAPRSAWPEPPSHPPTLSNHELKTPKFEATAEVPDEVQESPPVVEEPTAKPEPAVAPVKEIPEEIHHPTIPGCMIPNPEYVQQQKDLKKAKNKNRQNKAKQQAGQNEPKNKQSEQQNKNNANTSSKKNNKKKNKK